MRMNADQIVSPVHNNVDQWIEENARDFVPPICTKNMHGYPNGQMKCVFVGGPNQRSDFHIEEGEELFYMVKGDMCLKVIEAHQHKDIPIKEGEIFLLPRRIPHSPQRRIDTIGLIFERDRLPTEIDGMRFFVEKDGCLTTEILYEEWFHCENLGPQLAACIARFRASEQYRTGRPVDGADNPTGLTPLTVDSDTQLAEAFSLNEWLLRSNEEIVQEGHACVFPGRHETKVMVYGEGNVTGRIEKSDVWFWQLTGQSMIKTENTVYTMHTHDSLWLPPNTSYELVDALPAEPADGAASSSRLLMVYLEPPMPVSP